MERPPHRPAYRIETPRLVIRCYHPGDAPLLMAAIDESLDHLRPWMSWAHQQPEPLQAKIDRIRVWRGRFDLDDDYIYGIFNPDETRLLGGTGLHTRAGPDAREIGYWIHADQINQGLATETAAALTRVAIEVDGVRRVEIQCDPANARSAAVPRKLGFTHEATLRDRRPDARGVPRDSMIWTLFSGDYPDSPAAVAPVRAFDVIGRRLL